MPPTYSVVIRHVGVLEPTVLLVGCSWSDAVRAADALLRVETTAFEYVAIQRERSSPGPWDDSQIRPRE